MMRWLVPALTALTLAPSARADPMLGDGHSYQSEMLVLDVGAVGVSAFLGLLYLPNHNNPGMSVAGVVPPLFTGPFAHVAWGRPLPALISFLGWASVVATTLTAGALVSINGTGPSDNTDLAFGVASPIAIVGATGMTILDVFMARSPKPARAAATTWSPVLAPSRGGGLVGVAFSL
jgi:hypothetical protein